MKTSRQISPEIPSPRLSRCDPDDIGLFRQRVLTYYARHGRDLPWRITNDPYHILVSEIMLQQTQVDRVVRKYPLFVQVFPDFASLAQAPLPEVLSVWQGMGYNRRAIALCKSAMRVMEEFGGELPADTDTLATFPGIGRATASSICAFAFNQPVVFIETNIRRVFIHFFFNDQAIVTDADILPLVTQALYRKDPRTWYNALMDFGTDLKKIVPNPNRRSRQYAKQPAFEGSDRKIRGLILKLLLAQRRMTQKAIIASLSEDPGRVGRLIKDLEDEGFIAQTGSYLSIASR